MGPVEVFKCLRIWFSSTLKDLCKLSSLALRTDQKLVDEVEYYAIITVWRITKIVF